MSSPTFHRSYPDGAKERDRFVLERRGAREALDPWRHQGVIVEDEYGEDGAIARVATVFLTGRECPWRCVMCDLWRYTIEGARCWRWLRGGRRPSPAALRSSCGAFRRRVRTITHRLSLDDVPSRFAAVRSDPSLIKAIVEVS